MTGPPELAPSWAGELLAHAPGLGRLRDAVLEGAKLRPGDVVLDVGAGTGLLTFGAVPRVCPRGRVVAVDLDAGCLDTLARAAAGRDLLGRGVDVVAASAEALPLSDDSLDAVVDRSALAYVSDRAGAVRELYRALRPGGRVSLFEPLPAGLREESDFDWRPFWAIRLALEGLREEARRDPRCQAALELTAAGLAAALEAAGFVQIACQVRPGGRVGRASPREHFDSLRPPGMPAPGQRAWYARLSDTFAEADLRAYAEYVVGMADRGRYRVVLPTVFVQARKPDSPARLDLSRRGPR